jgi:uncharacterized protein (UPF0248 family)
MPFPKDILNELKWRADRDLKKARIWYVHRGAPNDTKIVAGSEILDLEHSFMVLSDARIPARIPYHRIFMIMYDGKEIFKRKKQIRKKGVDIAYGYGKSCHRG